MFEEIVSGAVAMLIAILLISMAFVMAYIWFVRGEGKTHMRPSSSLHKKKLSSNSKGGYTIFHGLYEAMRDKEEEKEDE